MPPRGPSSPNMPCRTLTSNCRPTSTLACSSSPPTSASASRGRTRIGSRASSFGGTYERRRGQPRRRSYVPPKELAREPIRVRPRLAEADVGGDDEQAKVEVGLQFDVSVRQGILGDEGPRGGIPAGQPPGIDGGGADDAPVRRRRPRPPARDADEEIVAVDANVEPADPLGLFIGLGPPPSHELDAHPRLRPGQGDPLPFTQNLHGQKTAEAETL